MTTIFNFPNPDLPKHRLFSFFPSIDCYSVFRHFNMNSFKSGSFCGTSVSPSLLRTLNTHKHNFLGIQTLVSILAAFNI